MTDLDATRARHVEVDGECASCIVQVTPGLRFARQEWPCDAARETARADKAEAALDALRDASRADERTFYKVKAERDAARVDAHRLAKALERLHDLTHGYGPCPDCYAVAALAAHREVTK
jgi:hypothetical protein